MNELRILKNLSTHVDNLLETNDLGNLAAKLQRLGELNIKAKVALEELANSRISAPTDAEFQKIKDTYSEQIDHIFRKINSYVKTTSIPCAQTDAEKVKRIEGGITYLKLRNAELEAHCTKNKDIENNVDFVFKNGLAITNFNSGGAKSSEDKLKIIWLMLQSCCKENSHLHNDIRELELKLAKTLFDANADLCGENQRLRENDPINAVKDLHAKRIREIKNRLKQEKESNGESQNSVNKAEFLSKDWENLNGPQFGNKSHLEVTELVRKKLYKLLSYLNEYEKKGVDPSQAVKQELALLWVMVL